MILRPSSAISLACRFQVVNRRTVACVLLDETCHSSAAATSTWPLRLLFVSYINTVCLMFHFYLDAPTLLVSKCYYIAIAFVLQEHLRI